MAAALLALGLDPERCTLFVQSHRPEHTELAWLLMTVTPVSWLERTPTYKEKVAGQPDDVNHGLLTYPVLQAADIVMYKATTVPVGKDQAAHLELSREIVRAFNRRYGDTFPEPQAVFTEAPVVLGTDGVRKMSKSLNNTIEIFAPEDEVRRQVMSMVTDTQRILRTDPGRPEVCNVCQLHRFFGDDYLEIQDGERTARTGCVDTKRLLADRILRHYGPARERYAELMAHPDRVDGILEAGADRLRPRAAETMDEVRREDGPPMNEERRQISFGLTARERRWFDVIIALTVVVARLRRPRLPGQPAGRLRRPDPRLLPGLAPGVHPHARSSPASRRIPFLSRAGRGLPRLRPAVRRPRVPGRRGRRRPGQLDHRLHRQRADPPRATCR